MTLLASIARQLVWFYRKPVETDTLVSGYRPFASMDFTLPESSQYWFKQYN
jgi:hypothetical protein